MKIKKIISALALTCGLVGFGSSAHALPIGLGIVLDESGSISPANWTLQKNAYANVLASALIPTDGSLTIGVWKFDDTVEQVFAPISIASAADKTSLIAAINGMVQGGGLTAIGDAVTAAYNAFNSLGIADFSKVVIDVSTDGGNNFGSNPTTASNAALAGGVSAVNCLGIGGASLCNWNPASSLDFNAATFADFENALETKIKVETTIPEPATLALMGLGVMGFGAFRRRQMI